MDVWTISYQNKDESSKDVQIQCRISYPWPKGGGGLQSLFVLLSNNDFINNV